MTLAAQIRARLEQGFPTLTAEERERLAEIFEDVHRVARAEGMLAAANLAAPFIANNLRLRAAAHVASEAFKALGESGEVPS